MLKIMFEEKSFAGFEKMGMRQLIDEKGMKSCAWMFEKPEIAGKEYFFIAEEGGETPANILVDKNGAVSLLMFLGDYSEAELVGEIVKKAFVVSKLSRDRIFSLSRESGTENTFKEGIERFLGENVVNLNEKQGIILLTDEDKDIEATIKWFEKTGMEIKKLHIALMKAGSEIFLLNGDEWALTPAAAPAEPQIQTIVEKVIERVEVSSEADKEELMKLQEILKAKEEEIEKHKAEIKGFEDKLLEKEREVEERKANLEAVEKELREKIENTLSGKESLDRKDSGDGKIKRMTADGEEVAKNLREILSQKDDYISKILKPFIKILSTKPKIFTRIELSEELYHSGVGFNENDAMKKLDRIVDHLIKEPNKYIDKVVEFEVLMKGSTEYGDNFSLTSDYRDIVKRVIKEF